ncbi:MAG: thioredoxin-disulfide reductase [Patescibacteria group bacterium]|jgi:thioredoxin-disulfide reductase|nr:thioredoxin-disulfide reductase [bacterium]HQC49915.1 thioredoxin-disulfide reductase [bacterium]
MYDTIIIGSGPAGMTAAIYAVRREMKTLLIGKEIGGQMILANEIENYPGFQSIKSFELIQKIKEQAVNFGTELVNEEVIKIEKQNNIFTVHTNKQAYQGKTVIITMGLSPRQLAVPGEKEFNGRGVSYCANCDGPFYKNKTVAVIGNGNSALDAAEVMSKIAQKVFLINRGQDFKAFDTLVNEVKKRENIEIVYDADTKEIVGEGKVEKLIYSHLLTNEEREIKTDGVFIEIGRIATTDLVADFVERDEQKQIIVNDVMETKTPGLFAAGDVTTVQYKQITIAMGQATIAALSAYQYIQMNAELLK